MSDFKPYLHSAHIEGYKSIVNCDVTFKPGLNIIIGKNGTGKTNLLEAVKEASFPDEDFLAREDEFASKVWFWTGETGEDKLEVSISRISHNSPKFGMPASSLDSQRSRISYFRSQGFKNPEFSNLGFYVFPLLFPHTIRTALPFINDYEAGVRIRPNSASRINVNSNSIGAFSALQTNVVVELVEAGKKKRLQAGDVGDLIRNQMMGFAKNLLPALSKCTPIQAIEVSDGRVSNGTLENELVATGFSFLFKINGTLQPFRNLSDGTKRMVLLTSDLIQFPKSSYLRGFDFVSIFLLEEPELGIHPHQLHLLMNFIKEQAKEKQIILTTHSPDVLNVLTEDEFDRIIIAEFNSKQGSTFRHLTEAEIQKAKAYVEAGLQISDYWKHSDLEPALN